MLSAGFIFQQAGELGSEGSKLSELYLGSRTLNCAYVYGDPALSHTLPMPTFALRPAERQAAAILLPLVGGFVGVILTSKEVKGW
jgi:hypothetical protein